MYRYLLDTEANSLREKGGPTMMFQGVNYIRSVKKSKDVKKTDWLSDKEVYAFEIAAEFLQGKKINQHPLCESALWGPETGEAVLVHLGISFSSVKAQGGPHRAVKEGFSSRASDGLNWPLATEGPLPNQTHLL